MSQLGRAVIVSLLAAAAGLTLSAQDPAPAVGRVAPDAGPSRPGTLVGGTLTPKKADERGWGWQVKAMMNPATPRPLYNRAKEALLSDRQITSYTISSFDPELYCEVAKHFDFIWFEMQHSTMSWDEIRRMMAACPKRRRGAVHPHARCLRVQHPEGHRPRRARHHRARRWTMRSRRGMRRGSRAIRRSAAAVPAAATTASCGPGSTIARRSTTTCS